MPGGEASSQVNQGQQDVSPSERKNKINSNRKGVARIISSL